MADFLGLMKQAAELKSDVRGDPLVQAVLTRFPGAEIVDVRPPAGPEAAADDLPGVAAQDDESDLDA